MLLHCVLLLIFVLTESTECSVETIQGRESTIYIDLDIIKSNYEELVKKLPPKLPIMAIVKANAYGVGAVAVSKTVVELGAKYLGVAFVDEGVYLRMHGIKTPILIMGYTSANGQGIDLAIRYNLTLNVFSRDVLNAVQRKAMRSSVNSVKIHIKVNTGLNRLGLEPNDLVPFVKLIKNGFYSRIAVEGVFSHFATLDDVPVTEYAAQYAKEQLATFKRVVKEARNVMIIPFAHIANSGAINFFGEEAFLDMVRPGVSILGITPFSRHVMSLKSTVTVVRQPVKGMQLGYEQNTTADGVEWIASIPLGYADGLKPDCGNGIGEVLIRGTRVPIVSAIMMDQMLVDVSRVYPIVVGEEVVIIGKQRGLEISVDDYAKMCGGTDLSLMTQLGKRIARVYLKNGRIVYFENNLLIY